MQMVAPLGSVYQAGTLSGNPLAMAAGLATLRLLDEARYTQLEQRCAQLHGLLQEAVYRASVPAHINRVGSMLSVFFSECPVTDSETALRTNRQMFSRVFQAMLRRGVFLPPSPLEAWFVSMAHTESHVERTAKAFAAALKEGLAG